MKTAIVPIIISKAGDTSDKSKFRPIALVTAYSKILSIFENYICIHDHQFGFKKQHATDMCIYTVKSVFSIVLAKTVLYIHVSLMHPKPLTELVTGLFIRN